ncbi:MAG: hypothetical protein JXB13_20190 [Phycisphaerae bacterium]|nr:hypothetical protein [Phycisphaerae bacterium]
MNHNPVDPMWPEFKPLWRGLQKAGSPMVLGGGYGLMLKQRWLTLNAAVPMAVPMERWLDATPRVTKDVDIVVGLDLIGSREAQRRMAEAMRDCGFQVSRENPRWQFQKKLSESRELRVEFHSCIPEPGEEHLRTDGVRVKHSPSLGSSGIHGRQNPEAAGADLHAFSFELDGVAIQVPNPVTWCNMKLTAMRDRRQRAEDPDRDEDYREFQRNAAVKHAQDVCRAVAMTTRDESDRARAVVKRIRDTRTYREAAVICHESFGGRNSWGARMSRSMWQDDDTRLILGILHAWYV